MGRDVIFKEAEALLISEGINIVSHDFNRPWGGFFVIDENQAQLFATKFFKGLDVESLKISGRLSPKLLVVEPHKRLSWQYHNRRAEVWRVVRGPVGVKRSDTDDEGELISYHQGEEIALLQGERHRLIGLENWGIIAEIWQHTQEDSPSDEEDIIRVQDDFGR